MQNISHTVSLSDVDEKMYVLRWEKEEYAAKGKKTKLSKRIRYKNNWTMRDMARE
jgi:hypothetical protein